MTYEVELKFRLSAPAAFLQRLSEGNAISEPAETQVDCYLAHPCRDFAVTDEALRVRTVGDRSFLTYKGPVLDKRVKMRRELEIPLDGEEKGGRFLDLFAELGFRPVLTVTKHRRPFRVEHDGRTFHVTLDEVPPLGSFAEIELLAQDGELSAAREAVQNLASDLGLDAAEEKTYLELMLETAPLEDASSKPS
jgi:adenylate cyclase class 2